MSASLRASLLVAFAAKHLPEIERQAAGHVPVAGLAPAVVVLETGDDAGERARAVLCARGADLRACVIAGRTMAWALVPAGLLPIVVGAVDSALALRLAASMEPVTLPECRIVVVAAGGASASVLLVGRSAA